MKANYVRLAKVALLAAVLVLAIGLRTAPDTIVIRHGEITAIDRVKFTLTVKEPQTEALTLWVTSQTRLYKYGEPATTSDLAVGDEVRGTAEKEQDRTVAVRLYVIRAAPPSVAGNF